MSIELPRQFPVSAHTRYIGPGSTFVAIRGFSSDGVLYIEQAIAQGARTIVIEQQVRLPLLDLEYNARGVQIVRVAHSRKALAQLSAQVAGYPAQKLRIIGITGTKGKTTSAFFLYHILQTAGYKTALLSTVKNMIMYQSFDTELTTQQPDYLHQFFKVCVEQEVQYVVMEIAAQALSLYRIEGIFLDGALFTNFSPEHGEFYPEIEDYFAAKMTIVKHLKLRAPLVLNADNEMIMKQEHAYVYDRKFFFGFHGDSCYKGTFIQNHPFLKLLCSVNNQEAMEIIAPNVMGECNAYNILGVCALAHQLGISLEQIIKAFNTVKPVCGRLEQYRLSNKALCIIDYASNASSYESILSLLRQITTHLIVVFGAGGERDQQKRPIMGALVAQYADVAIVTSDNPRNEDPQQIIQEVVAGMVHYSGILIQELDREKAIKQAYAISKAESVIALLGKGHEEYQKIGDIKYYFSEREIVKYL